MRLRLSDVALVVGSTARLSRLIISDDIGDWWVKEPLAALARANSHVTDVGPDIPRWTRYLDGLDCKHCVGYWAGVATMGSYLAARAAGPKPLAIWRFVAGTLSLNVVLSVADDRLDYL